MDDRAINQRVWARLRREISLVHGPLRIVELGAGIGNMVERLVEWGLLTGRGDCGPNVDSGNQAQRVDITLVDNDTACVREARSRLTYWADRAGFSVAGDSTRLHLRRPDLTLVLTLVACDALQFVDGEAGSRRWDLILANAFLDLIDTSPVLPFLFSLLRPGGVFYFTSNFDGEIILEPALDGPLDDDLPRMLCAAMSTGTTGGRGRINSRIGRQLFHQVKRAGADVIDMGSSDWTIFPGPDGYDADEEYFLHHLIHFIANTLMDSPPLDPEALAAWVEQRHRQIDEAQLVYISHQIDILGRLPGAEPDKPTLGRRAGDAQ